MNAIDILKNGHAAVLATVEHLPEADWHRPGVCGAWSVKDIIAHLTSFEQVLVDVLKSLQGDTATPNLNRFCDDYETFNETEVAARRDKNSDDVLAEYVDAYTQAMELLTQIPLETRCQNGILHWYGQEYDLDDFIVYTFYGHKQEHCAQISVFKDQLERIAAGGIA